MMCVPKAEQVRWLEQAVKSGEATVRHHELFGRLAEESTASYRRRLEALRDRGEYVAG